ncbi:MAG: VCBS repeat-containing protein, partial [Desulfuromonadales bacterium]|nr:VCBS repeat-containing protein [Desulfuromonadales bacterium]
AGAYTVVVERAGCEQFIAQVEMTGTANADVAAVLELAIAPEFRRDADLRAGKSRLRVGLNAAPFAVDFNNDGLTDLLVGDESGTLTLFAASTRGGGSRVWYEEGKQLKVAPISGAVPFVVDWNNDNRKDLLVGGVDGRVFLFLQETASSDLSPAFSSGTPLKIDALDDLNVGSPAYPAVADLDGDGDKDLVVGTASGKLFSFLNVGTDAAPLLAAATEIGSFSGPVVPLFIDWDADGQRDLLISNVGSLFLLAKGENGLFSVDQTLLSSRSAYVDENIKYFVADLDSAQGKDVLVGFSDGKVTYFESVGRDYLPSVTRALLDKLAQVQTLAGDAVPLDAVAVAIEGADFSAAGRLAKNLFKQLPASSELETASAELLLLLGQ